MNALLQWFTSSEWTLAVKALLHTLWQGAIIAITLGLAMRRIANPANRYRLSFGALASVMLIGVLTWAWLNRPEPAPGVVAATPAVFIEQPPPVISDGLPPIVVTAIRQESKPAPAGWTAWLALVWLAGAAAMLGRVGFQVAGAERLRRSCKPLDDERVTRLLAEAQRAVRLTRKIRVAVTDRLTSPAVVGVIVPTLILPLSLLTALTPEQLRFVLLHELAHIRRGDYFANLFQLFAEALLFFNPAVWWISHQVRREREACCDALAIELSGAPVDYAKTLVQVAENILDNTPAAAPAFGGTGREPSQLADRVQRLLVPGYRPSLRLTWRAMLAALLVGGALLFLFALGARNVVGAVASTVTDNATNSATNVVVSGGSAADLKNESFTMPKWEGSWKKGDVQPTNSGARGMSRWGIASDEEVLARLEQIKFDRVFYQNRKLSEVLGELDKALLATDPDKQGFRLSLPPDWEYPARWKGMESVVINMPSELNSITMRSVLDAIVSSASKPIRYKFGGFCANFEMKFDAPTNMWFQRFDVNREVFLPFIGVNDSSVGNELQHSSNLVSADWIGDAIRERFLKARVDLRPPNAVLYKLETGQLYVYAPKKDLEVVEKLLKDNTASSHRQTGVPSLDPSSTAGMDKWTVDGKDQLYQKWFRYRAGTNKAGPNESFPKVLDKGRQGILQRLDHILLDNYSCDKLPLKEVLHRLSERTRQLDPTKEGINFVIRPEPRVGTNASVDVAAIPITIRTNYTLASLGNIIYFVVKNAATPIEYSIEDTQVVFYLKPGSGRTNSATSNQRQTRGAIDALADKYLNPQIGFDSQPGMSSWKVTGQNELTKQWFYFRTSPGPADAISTTNDAAFSLSRYATTSNSFVDSTSFSLEDIKSQPFILYADSGKSPPRTGESVVNDASGGERPIETSSVATRTYAVGPMELARALGMTGPSAGTNAAEMVHALLANAGVDLKPPRSVVFKDTLGLLMVHATEDELDAIEKLLVQANRDVPFSKPPTEKVSEAASLKPVPMKNPKVVESDNSTNLYTRTFSVDGEALLKVLYRQLGNNASPGAKRPPEKLSSEVRELFSGLGMDLQPPKAVFFNGDNGKLLVRATQKDMDFIESVIEVVNYQPPQVNIKARFIEVPYEAMPKVMGLLFTNSVAVRTNQFAQVLTAAQHRRCLKELDNIPGVHLLASPEVTTLSGRQAQLQVVEMKTVVIGLSPVLTNGVTNMVPTTQDMTFGPVLDVTPYASAHGHAVQMTLIPTVTEFLGYDNPGQFLLPAVSPREYQRLSESRVEPDLPLMSRSGGASMPPLATTPLPRFRVRQMVTNVVVWSGQAVVLGNFPNTRISTRPDGTSVAEELGPVTADKAVLRDKLPLLGDAPVVGTLFRSVSSKAVKKQLLVFVVPTLIDSAGNPIYPGVGVDGPNF